MNFGSDLHKRLIEFFDMVDLNNYRFKYDELRDMVISYNTKLSWQEVYDIYLSIDKLSGFNEAQEEVYLEIGNRLHGYCPPFKRIYW